MGLLDINELEKSNDDVLKYWMEKFLKYKDWYYERFLTSYSYGGVMGEIDCDLNELVVVMDFVPRQDFGVSTIFYWLSPKSPYYKHPGSNIIVSHKTYEPCQDGGCIVSMRYIMELLG